jgi:hypothetical protein
MEYRQMEAILAELHRVKPEHIGALRSRLRVLRDIGVPAVFKPGKGSRIDYRFDDLLQAHLGLRLEHFGFPPLRVKSVIKSVPDQWLEKMRDVEDTTGTDAWAFFSTYDVQRSAQDPRLSMQIASLGDVSRVLHQSDGESWSAALCGLLNLSLLNRECEKAMAKLLR